MAAGKWLRSWLGRRTGRWSTGEEMSEPTAHQGDSTADVSPHEHCSRKILTSFSRHDDHRQQWENRPVNVNMVGGDRRTAARQRYVFLQIRICFCQKDSDKVFLINDHLLLLAQKPSSTLFVGILHLDEDNENASNSNSCP